MTYTVDGVALNGFTASTMTVAPDVPRPANNLNVSPNSTINDAGVHTFVTGNNYNTFPHLNEVGFSVKNVGDDVTVTDYRLVDVAQSAKRTLFDSTTGANYGIFTALPNSGITTTGNAIRVNPTAAGQLGPKYADPSYGAQTQVRSEFRLDPTRTSPRRGSTSPRRAPTRCSSTASGSARTTSTPAWRPTPRR